MKRHESESEISQELSNEEPSSVPNQNDEEKPRTFELTVNQAEVIRRMLPKHYTLVVHQDKPKRVTRSMYRLPSKRNQDLYFHNYIHQTTNPNKVNDQQFKTSSLVAKKCRRLISLLNRDNYSAPFKDSQQISMNSYESRPADQSLNLTLIGKKVRSLKYKSLHQFFDDVDRMVSQAYENNQQCPRLTKITEQFEKNYTKLKAAQLVDQQPEKKGKPIKKQEMTNPKMKISEKRRLRMRLVKLPQVAQRKIIEKVKESTVKKLDLEILSEQKLRQIQRCVEKQQQVVMNEKKEETPPIKRASSKSSRPAKISDS